jgi:hypothetical protein
MTTPTRKRPRLRRETLRRLAAGDLQRAAGGLIARCTYERSGCYGNVETWECLGSGEDPDDQASWVCL